MVTKVAYIGYNPEHDHQTKGTSARKSHVDRVRAVVESFAVQRGCNSGTEVTSVWMDDSSVDSDQFGEVEDFIEALAGREEVPSGSYFVIASFNVSRLSPDDYLFLDRGMYQSGMSRVAPSLLPPQ